MAEAIKRQKCHHHASREAAGRCMDCRKMFCKECVSTYKGRLLCAPCLATHIPAASPQQRWGTVVAPLQLVAGLVTLGIIFYGAASLLSVAPATFFDRDQSWYDYDPDLPDDAPEDADDSLNDEENL